MKFARYIFFKIRKSRGVQVRLVVLIFLVIQIGIFAYFMRVDTSKVRICPNQWIHNKQPCVYQYSSLECENPPREYFVIDGKRKEIKEVDVEWVKENCPIKKPSNIL